MLTAATKPSRLATQDPQEVNAAGNKPSENQSSASPGQNLNTQDGAMQQGTTGAISTPSGHTIPNPANPHATKAATTNYTTENLAYAQGLPSQESQEALDQTLSAPPPPRKG